MAIQDNNISYTLLRRYVACTYGLAYSEVEYVGRENIPTDGAVIFAPNHTNAFMDALTVLSVKRSATVFVSRADVFRNPRMAKLLTFFKIMPIMRMRDGRENLKKNDAIMRKAVDVLEAGVPFCIFSEGTHRMMHSILPLSKGIFRIALQCNDELAGRIPVYIVPMGIEYGSYTRYRSTLTVNVGQPLNVSEFAAAHASLERPEMIMTLRADLWHRMAALFHCVPDNEDYEAALDYCYLKNRAVLADRKMQASPHNVMLANRETVDNLEYLKKNRPDAACGLFDVMREFALARRSAKIDDESLYDCHSAVYWACNIIAMLILAPYILACSIINAPIALIQWLILRMLDDEAFYNSFRFVVVVLLMPLILIVLAVCAAQSISWYGVLAVVLLAAPANIVTDEFVKRLRVMRSDFRLKRLLNKSSRLSAFYEQCKRKRNGW